MWLFLYICESIIKINSFSFNINPPYFYFGSILSYIILKSKQRALSRINSKISRLNKYYNNPSELLARFCELYFLDEQASCTLAPTAVMQFKQSLERKKVPEFYRLAKMMSKF